MHERVRSLLLEALGVPGCEADVTKSVSDLCCLRKPSDVDKFGDKLLYGPGALMLTTEHLKEARFLIYLFI